MSKYVKAINRVKPAGHRVLIKVEKTEEKTESGIILPQQTTDQMNLSSEVGEVVAIGSTAFDAFDPGNRWGIEVGQKVLFVRQGGKIVPNRLTRGVDDIYRIVNDEDIIAIVREDA
jgi:co-chaperonin GroES (HSP10)